MVVISVYTYGVKIIKKFRWESGFLWGVPWNPPLCTNGSAGYLMQLKVDMPILTCKFFTNNWLTLTSEMHFVKFHPEVASCLLSRG